MIDKYDDIPIMSICFLNSLLLFEFGHRKRTTMKLNWFIIIMFQIEKLGNSLYFNFCVICPIFPADITKHKF